jgi:transposase-like protein
MAAPQKASEPDDEIRCPRCDSDAIYRYGKTQAGKKRFCCMVCKRQFVLGSSRREVEERPICPACGSRMHVYMREADAIRFRCAAYPRCRTFLKTPVAEEKEDV